MIRLLWAQTTEEEMRRQQTMLQRIIAQVARYVVPVIPRSKKRARKNTFVVNLRRCF